MFQELKEGLCKWSVVSKEQVMYKFGEVGTAQVMENLTDRSKCLIKCMCDGRPLKLKYVYVQFSSVAQSCPTLQPHESHHTRPPYPSPTPGVHSDSRPSSL